ncbi:MAG: hypothetical protein CMI26_05020 [Opitutae bacterium]|nr:hypothetical protein [Opitutae bacterium]|tara:strand:- start:1125 stop:1946 length:822 start_codon:yes stop_codon:yes gene_type:complete
MRLLGHSGLLYLFLQAFVSVVADDKIFPEARRTWKDVDGREIQAVFKGLDGDKVKLEKDGQVYIFPLSKLSATDQTYAHNLQAPPPKPLPIGPDATKPPALSDLELRVAPDVNVARVEQHVVFFVNEARKVRNLKPLDSNDRIALVARSHSMDMANRGFFAHVNPDGENASARANKVGFTGLSVAADGQPRPVLAENVGKVGRYSSIQVLRRDGKVVRRRIRWQTEAKMAEQLVLIWMATPAFRANILDPSKAYFGLGVHVHREHVFATQNFF